MQKLRHSQHGMLKKVFIIGEVILIGIALVKSDLLVFLCLGNGGY